MEVGIITPYEGQRVESLEWFQDVLSSFCLEGEGSEAYICSVLQRQTCFSHKAYEEIEVASVDSFQGREKVGDGSERAMMCSGLHPLVLREV